MRVSLGFMPIGYHFARSCVTQSYYCNDLRDDQASRFNCEGCIYQLFWVSAVISENDKKWPESRKAAKVISRRCAKCHTGHRRLPKKLSDERGISFWRPNWNDKALALSRHFVFNLSNPEKSLVLLASLAKTAGRHAVDTKGKKYPHPVVFKDTNDADYQAIPVVLPPRVKAFGDLSI